MVHSLTLISVVGALSMISARAGLQLTPSITETEIDGAKLQQLAFSDGDQKVTYQSPRGWDYSGNGAQLTLHPPKKPQAEAMVIRIPRSEPGTFDEASLKKLIAEALASIPGGSTNASVVSQEKNPLLIGRKETCLIILGYEFYGQAYKRSILFLNRDRDQIRFQLTCREADFKDLHKAFLGSQYTWHNL
jgi:hypothetical protein